MACVCVLTGINDDLHSKQRRKESFYDVDKFQKTTREVGVITVGCNNSSWVDR